MCKRGQISSYSISATFPKSLEDVLYTHGTHYTYIDSGRIRPHVPFLELLNTHTFCIQWKLRLLVFYLNGVNKQWKEVFLALWALLVKCRDGCHQLKYKVLTLQKVNCFGLYTQNLIQDNILNLEYVYIYVYIYRYRGKKYLPVCTMWNISHLNWFVSWATYIAIIFFFFLFIACYLYCRLH